MNRRTISIYPGLCLFASVVAVSPLAVYAQNSGIQEVEIQAHPLSAEGLSQPVAVISGDDLSQALQTTIGATVTVEPGVRQQSFGEAAGRPIIHGLAGPRVRILEDRIDTLDVSVTSTDHAVGIEPFIADRVEIIKGASSLLYGSGAIGGVVDVHTGRIPHSVKPTSGRIEGRYADNGSRKVGAFRFDGGSGNIAWHIDGFGRDADIYDIPGLAESAIQLAAEGETGEGEAGGELPGSQLRNHGGALGASWIGDKGFIGLAVSALEADYGLPGGHAHEDDPMMMGGEEEEGNPTLQMEQIRVDIEAARKAPIDGFESINFRVGINNYQHDEFEPDGAAGTRFDNEAVELRLEAVHSPILDWDGSFGIQYTDREFSAAGEEAFVEPVDTQSTGIFWVGQRGFDGFDLEAGVRVEQLEHKPSGSFPADQACILTGDLNDQDYDVFSASLGAIVPLADNMRVRVAVDYGSRAPTAEELFSCGPHLASQTFEIGNLNLEEESAVNLSVTFDYQNEDWALETTFYHIEFSDFIFEGAFDGNDNAQIEGSGVFNGIPDGLQDVQDELPVFLWQQADATFTGADLKVAYTAMRWNNGDLAINALFDTVRARVDQAGGEQPLPRIPASRYGLGLETRFDNFNANINYQRVEKQDDIAEFELETEAYNELSAYLGYTVPNTGDKTRMTVFLQGRNLTDDEQRNHSSFIKDFAPAPGRLLEVGTRVTF